MYIAEERGASSQRILYVSSYQHTSVCMYTCVHMFMHFLCICHIICNRKAAHFFHTSFLYYALMFRLNGFFKAYTHRRLQPENVFFQGEPMFVMVAL